MTGAHTLGGRSGLACERGAIVGLALAAALATLAGCGAGDEGRRPDLILITVDTLRADHVGCYGHSSI